jgi:hypothetical protein
MHVGRKVGLIVIPEFGRLVAKVPASIGSAGTEDALLAADQLLVAADAEQDSAETPLGDDRFQSQRLARRGARGRRQRRVGRLDRGAGRVDVIETPFVEQPVAECVDLRKLVAGIEQHHRERNAAQKRLSHEPDHRVRILAQRPEHRERLQPRVSLADDVDRLLFESVQVVRHRLGADRIGNAGDGRRAQ